METVNQVIAFVQAHGQEILAGIGGLYLFLLTVVKLTPTPKDDEILDKIYQFVHRFTGAFGVKK